MSHTPVFEYQRPSSHRTTSGTDTTYHDTFYSRDLPGMVRSFMSSTSTSPAP